MLVEDIRQELQLFSRWRMKFTPRESNTAAHALARLASRQNVTQQWLCTTPECITEIVRMELPALA
jgi:hypothetical protein